MTAKVRVLTALQTLVLAAALLVGGDSPAADSVSFVNNLLRQQRFSAGDLRALDAGEAVVKTLDTPVRRELAHFGVVHIDGATDRFVARFRDIERFERGPGIPQIGRFGSPPQPGDLATLTLPARDVTALAECRPGDCDVKLSAEAMTRFRNQVNWASPNAERQVQEIARAMLLELVRAYQTKGDAALGQYEDDDEPLPVAEEFRALLMSGSLLPLPVPGLIAYLEEYPRRQLPGAEDFFYWSMVDFGLKPTVRLNHVVIYPVPGKPSGVSHVVAIKQLYASHYFQTTLELRFLIEDERRPDRRGFYLVSITRSRIDGTTGLKGSILRPIISRRSRNAVEGYLEHLKKEVERSLPATF